MKIRSMLLIGVLLTASAPASLAGVSPSTLPSPGFAGILKVQSVVTNWRKAVFVVNGESSLLLSKPSDPSGKDLSNAQVVSYPLDRTVVVFYRLGGDFPTEDDWNKECRRFEGLVNKRAYFVTTTPHYTFESADLTLVSTEHLRVEVQP